MTSAASHNQAVLWGIFIINLIFLQKINPARLRRTETNNLYSFFSKNNLCSFSGVHGTHGKTTFWLSSTTPDPIRCTFRPHANDFPHIPEPQPITSDSTPLSAHPINLACHLRFGPAIHHCSYDSSCIRDFSTAKTCPTSAFFQIPTPDQTHTIPATCPCIESPSSILYLFC